MYVGTPSAHSSGVPRVGLRASRAMGGGAAQGRGRPSDGDLATDLLMAENHR